LAIFNALEDGIKESFRRIWRWQESLPECLRDPALKPPETLSEWETYVKIAILAYGAYFQAFKGPGEQYVGGGVDTVKLAWPGEV
jgi:hypothetical protein